MSDTKAPTENSSQSGLPAVNKPLLIAWYDTETNGLLREATKMHSVGIVFSDGRTYSCADQPGFDGRKVTLLMPSGRVIENVIQVGVERGRQLLQEADIRVAHNGQDFDDRVSRKLFPQYEWPEHSRMLDTLIMSHVLFPDPFRLAPNTSRLPPKLRKKHSLEAWGLRLGEAKNTEFDGGDWQTWTPEMQLYMLQDVFTLVRLFKYFMSLKPSQEMLELEHDFAAIIRRQEVWGFRFDHDKALDLSGQLQQDEQEIESELIAKYGEWWVPGNVSTVTATRNVKMVGHPDVTIPRISATTGKPLKPYVGPPLCSYEEGAKFTPIKRVQFNPASRDHVRLKLEQTHGWKPKQFTAKGTPEINDEVLRALPWPEAQRLADYYVVLKIRGYLSTGRNAWLKLATNDGPMRGWRLHGRVNTNGAISGRCAHFSPNLGQVPSLTEQGDVILKGLEGGYGFECRDLFVPTESFHLIGHDGSGLEYCLLAHYITPFDGGQFAHVVETMKPHAWLRDEIVGTDIVGEGQEGYAKMKTLGYAFIYGAGDEKLGRIVTQRDKPTANKKLGKEVRTRLVTKFGLGKLQEKIEHTLSRYGYLPGLDGRKLHARKPHGALNILLQSGGAVVMKKSFIILDRSLQEHGLRCGVDDAGSVAQDADYEFCVNVHDEAQTDVKPQHLALYRKLALESVPEAGRQLKLRCALKAEAKEGSSWAFTH